MSNPAKKNKSQEWAEIVSKSGGSRVMFPEEMKDEYKVHEARNAELQKMANEFNKKKAEVEHANEDFWFRVRKALEPKVGIEIWGKGFGLDQEAKKEGVMVLNLHESER